MPRSKNKVASHRRRKKIFELAKGYWGRRSKVYTVAKNAVEKGLLHAYVGRKLKKRTYRQIWITRINAAARLNGTTYSRLMDALRKKAVAIDRKLLSNLAYDEPNAFTEIVKFALN